MSKPPHDDLREGTTGEVLGVAFGVLLVLFLWSQLTTYESKKPSVGVEVVNE